LDEENVMSLTCSKKALSDALGITARAVKPRSPLPVLQCVRFTATDEVVRLYATDYEVAIETVVPAQVTECFDIALPAKQFSEIVHAMPGEELKIKLTDAGNVTFQSKKSSLRMAGVSPEDMVTLPPVDDEIGLILPEFMLRAIINRVVFAAATEDSRPHMCGSNFVVRENFVEMAATDGHVLSVHRQMFDGPMGRELSAIIPRQTQLDLLKLLKETGEDDVLVKIDSQEIGLQIEGRFTMISRLIAGDFCDYSKIRPKDPRVSVVVDREAMLDAVKRLSIAAREDSHRIFCEYTGATLQMKAQAAGGDCDAEEEVQIILEGGPISNVLNAQQVMSVLAAFDCEEVHLGIEASMRPMMMCPVEGHDYFAVVMPMHPA
jgi:DNA polymerase-3 subunit beta